MRWSGWSGWSGFLLRAFVWSVLAYGVWEAFEPLHRKLLVGVAETIEAITGKASSPGIQETSKGGALFLALYLAHRRPWKKAWRGALMGICVCLASEVVAKAVFSAFPADRTPAERMIRGGAFGLEQVVPLLAWLLLSPWQFRGHPRRPWMAKGGPLRPASRR